MLSSVLLIILLYHFPRVYTLLRNVLQNSLSEKSKGQSVLEINRICVCIQIHIYALCGLCFIYVFGCINTHVLIHINRHM